MIRPRFALPLVLAASVVACQPSAPEPSASEGSGAPASSDPGASLDERVERAVSVATALQGRPGEEAEILAEHDLTIEQFEDLMMTIASDADLSAQWADHRPDDAR